jgi:hypothetical protein
VRPLRLREPPFDHTDLSCVDGPSSRLNEPPQCRASD